MDEKCRREIRQYPEGDVELKKHFFRKEKRKRLVDKKTLKDTE